jgi:hypothetical protein
MSEGQQVVTSKQSSNPRVPEKTSEYSPVEMGNQSGGEINNNRPVPGGTK